MFPIQLHHELGQRFGLDTLDAQRPGLTVMTNPGPSHVPGSSGCTGPAIPHIAMSPDTRFKEADGVATPG